MKISSSIKNIVNEITEWRHQLHANPELGYEETWTSDFICKKLKAFGKHENSKNSETAFLPNLI